MPAPLTRESLHGIWAALITPWDAHDQLDEARLADEVSAYGGTGIHGVYTGGTTGEFYAQDDETFARITRVVCDSGHAAGLPVQIGVTALATRTVCQRIRIAAEAGADGVQVALPFWLELKDDEVVSFLTRVAGEFPAMPMIFYHTMRSKRRLSPELLGRLAGELPNLIGTKEPGVSREEFAALREAAGDLALFCTEADSLHRLQSGARGIYSAVSGLNAQLMARYYRHAEAGEWAQAETIYELIDRMKTGVLHPMLHEAGLLDSAIDRVMRMAGGGNVGLNCQEPYRSGTQAHVDQLLAWCREHTPELLDRSAP